jgi:hypothetical protein
LIVVDEHRRREVVAVLLGDLLDEVQRQRRVLPAGPHDRWGVVLLEAGPDDLDRRLDFVLQFGVVRRGLALAVGVRYVDVLRELAHDV